MLLVCAMATAHAARVTDMAENGALRLDDDRVVTLRGVWLPDEFHAAAQALAVGREVELQSEMRDRHGNLQAMMMTDGQSLQALLLAVGLAQVRPQVGMDDVMERFYAAETIARDKGLGVWASTDNGLRTPANVAQRIGHFAVAQGTVVDVATAKGTTYVNFGDDWRTDFTLALAPGLTRTMKVKDWVGRTVRVRGWVQSYNGPLIAITNKYQVELLFMPIVSDKHEGAPRDSTAESGTGEGG